MAKSEIVEPREIVKADNEFFRARQKIKDVVAGRIFMAFASLVDEKYVNTHERFLTYKISASSVLTGNNTSGEKYKQIRDAAYSLIDQKLEKRKSKNSFSVYTLFSKIDYSNGTITGEFHKDLVPFFIGVKKVFTRLNLQQYMKLPSIYSQRLFGYLKSWDDKPEIEINLLELHDMLDTPVSFRANFAELKRRVLEKAHNDILKHTSLYYEWEPIKKGRAVVAVRFIFSKKCSLPVLKKKGDNARQKLIDKNNDIGNAAVNCSNKKNGRCTRQDNKPEVCKYCVQFGVCKEIALSLL